MPCFLDPSERVSEGAMMALGNDVIAKAMRLQLCSLMLYVLFCETRVSVLG